MIEKKKTVSASPSLLWKGALFGIANVIPGVSGGTMAVITGVYNDFMESIAHFIKNWKFLALYLGGALIGIVAAAFGLEKLFELWPAYTLFCFMGFILGGLPALWKQADLGNKIKVPWVIAFVLAFAAMVVMGMFIDPSESQAQSELTVRLTIFLFLASMAGASAMVIPGISGSFLLLLLGMYTTVVGAVTRMDITMLFIIAAGVAAGLLLSARLISFLLKNFRETSYAAILGLVLASAVALWPGIPGGWGILLSVLFFGAGALGGYFLGDR